MMIDEFISREGMLNSLKRIGHSLNCRFEKDANLFISNQKSQEIKSMIHNNNWQGIHGMYITNDVSADILSIEIIKHSWLINTMSNEHSKYISEIFENCNKDILTEKATKVINNDIYSPYCIKKLIIPIYYMNVNVNICKEIIDLNKNNLIFNEDIRKVCIKRILDSCKTPRELYLVIKKYLNSNEILKTSNVFKLYIEKSDKEGQFLKELGQLIFENEIEDNIDYRDTSWFKIFRSMGIVAFDICSEYLEEYSEHDKDFSVSIVKYLMAYQFKNDSENTTYFEEKWVELFNDYGNVKRLSLILGLRNIWNEESKINIGNKILENTNITHKQIELIERALDSGTQLSDPINNFILDTLVNDKLNNNNRKGHLNYLVGEFLRRYKQVEEVDAILQNLENENIEEFIVELINQSRNVDNKMLRYLLQCILIGKAKLEENEIFGLGKNIEYIAITTNYELENRVVSFIEAKPSDFNKVKDLIQQYNFDFYKKVYGNM